MERRVTTRSKESAEEGSLVEFARARRRRPLWSERSDRGETRWSLDVGPNGVQRPGQSRESSGGSEFAGRQQGRGGGIRGAAANRSRRVVWWRSEARWLTGPPLEKSREAMSGKLSSAVKKRGIHWLAAMEVSALQLNFPVHCGNKEVADGRERQMLLTAIKMEQLTSGPTGNGNREESALPFNHVRTSTGAQTIKETALTE